MGRLRLPQVRPPVWLLARVLAKRVAVLLPAVVAHRPQQTSFPPAAVLGACWNVAADGLRGAMAERRHFRGNACSWLICR